MNIPLKADPKLIAAHYDVLINQIGVRVAGSQAEKAAGQYMSREFNRLGAISDMETFPVRNHCIEQEYIEIRTGFIKAVCPCSLLGASPLPENTVEAPLTFFYGGVDYQRNDLSFLRDKAVVHIGNHIKNRENYRRLIAARPAFLIFTDIRYPGTTPTADGLFPSYVQDIGAVPSVMAAYFDVWNWMKNGAETAALHITGEIRTENSLNIIADFPGSDPESGIIYTGGHLDSQANTPGADDNGSGLVFQLELARVLAPLKLRRTIRHISFGAEEQLSVGSAAYVRKHWREIAESGRFMFNADSCGSLLGWTVINYNSPENIRTMLTAELSKINMCAQFTSDTIPFTDQFPFAAAGVPGLWLYRQNCSSGNWYHHRPENDLTVVSPTVIASYVDIAAAFLVKLSAPEHCPVERQIPAAQLAPIKQCWQDLFGGKPNHISQEHE